MAFLLLLAGLSLALFSLRFLEIFAILLRAFLIGSPRFMQSNRYRLPAAFHGLSSTRFKLAMLVLMHDTAQCLFLTLGFLWHLMILARLERLRPFEALQATLFLDDRTLASPSLFTGSCQRRLLTFAFSRRREEVYDRIDDHDTKRQEGEGGNNLFGA